MISYSAALRMVLSYPLPHQVEECLVARCAGRVLAGDFDAPEDLPRADCSLLDGFAVRARDLRGASERRPIVLTLIGASRAGRAYDGPPLAMGQAISIATGGVMPEGSDAVAPVEWVLEADPHRVAIARCPAKGHGLRHAGCDVTQGDELLRAGTVLGAGAAAAIGQFGLRTIPVVRRPRVAVLTSGDELVAIGHSPRADQVVATSLDYTRLTLEGFGCEARSFGIARDRKAAVAALFARALEWGDIVVTLAGVSVGERDLVPAALEDFGARTLFHGVAIKPGKPTLFALVGDKVVFGLPGNPLAGAATLSIFVKPYIRRCLGLQPDAPPRLWATLTRKARRDSRRLLFLFSRLVWKNGEARVEPPSKDQQSGNLSLLGRADCLSEIPAGEKPLRAGDRVRVWSLP